MKTIGVYVNVGNAEIKDIPAIIQKIKDITQTKNTNEVKYFYFPVRSDLSTPIQYLGDAHPYVGFVNIGNMYDIQEITDYFNLIKDINHNQEDICFFPVRTDLQNPIHSFRHINYDSHMYSNRIFATYLDVGNATDSGIENLLKFSSESLTLLNPFKGEKWIIPVRKSLTYPIQVITF